MQQEEEKKYAPISQSIPTVPPIIAFAIYPYYWNGEKDVLQTSGADEKTNGYKVYRRYAGGELVWQDDWPTEVTAIDAAVTLARFIGVPVEPYEWMKLKPPSIAERDAAFEAFAQQESTVPGPGGYGREHAKIIWDGACEWMRRVFAAKM